MAYIDKYKPDYSLKFTGNKYGFDQNKKIYNYPLYMISSWIKHDHLHSISKFPKYLRHSHIQI